MTQTVGVEPIDGRRNHLKRIVPENVIRIDEDKVLPLCAKNAPSPRKKATLVGTPKKGYTPPFPK